jgi:predicted metal-dependent hydrolase
MTEPGFDLHSYARGIRLFNEKKFFDAHEVLEDVWRAAPVDRKKFLQGLIQVAVAFHHHSRGNTVGAVSLLKRAARNLSAYPDEFGGIRVKPLLSSMNQCAQALEHGLPLPHIPRLDEPEC